MFNNKVKSCTVPGALIMAHFTTESLKLENNKQDNMFCEADPVIGLGDMAEDVRWDLEED